jgi:hypothetical protein
VPGRRGCVIHPPDSSQPALPAPAGQGDRLAAIRRMAVVAFGDPSRAPRGTVTRPALTPCLEIVLAHIRRLASRPHHMSGVPLEGFRGLPEVAKTHIS